MARKTIHINTLINKAMHRPVVRSTGEVLYPVLEGYSGRVEGGASNKSQEFIEQSKLICNSPTNIRRIFITYDGVTVDYFSVPISSRNDGKLRASAKFSSVIPSGLGVSNFKDIAIKMLTYRSDLSSYMAEKQVNKNAQAPTEFVVNGNVFGVLSNTYACNNIEEVYVDWTIMLCDGIRQLVGNDAVLGENMLSNYVKDAVQSGIISDNRGILDRLFRRFNDLDKSNSDIKSRFPRLKVIAFVPKLQQLMTLQEFNNTRSIMPSKSDTEQAMLEKCATLLETNKAVFAQAGCMFKLFKSSNKLNREFRVKDSQYKFDRERLKTFVSLYNEKTATIIRNAKYGGASAAGSASASISEEEQYIKNILENNPTEANRILTLASMGHSVSEIKELLVSLSKPTRNKVASIIKFDLSLLNK